MASSRRSARNADPGAARGEAELVVAVVREALAGEPGPVPRGALHESGDVSAGAGRAPGDRSIAWIVAFSGGLDSTVLLHAAARAVEVSALVAVHVHHGLQPAADAWPAHCEAQARALGVRFECARLAGAPARGESVEAWAREARYHALVEAARRHGAAGILTAHHADDQVETVLMRVARGTGLDGLAGMDACSTRDGVPLLRPLLALPRAALADYARRHALAWVEDPSNTDTRRTRNALRHRVLPAIDSELPGFRERLLESLEQVREARDALAALAAEDLARARTATGLDRRALVVLAPARRDAALRAWLRELGLRPATQARLREMTRQLVEGEGAHGRVRHEGRLLMRDRDAILAVDAALVDAAPLPAQQLRWDGEPFVELAAWGGRLCFEPVAHGAVATAAAGVSASWLREQSLVVASNSASSERLRPAANARSRTLKNLYQERGVPAWRRAGLPRVYAGGRLLFAAGVGMDCSALWPREGGRVTLRWRSSSDSESAFAVLSIDEYRALTEAAQDARDAVLLERAARRIARGEEETFPAEVVDRLLSGESPIRVWREFRGLTAAALAQRLGVTPAHVSKLENGKGEPSVALLRKMAQVLDVDQESPLGPVADS
jgi:tRNA(Ile)-lysidine synthase